MDKIFNIGDIVCLKSGTRKMEISAINGNKITCKYKSQNKKTHKVILLAKMLKKHEIELMVPEYK